MKIKALHPQKHFLKFLILILLVLGGSVGVILATQKEAVFDESQAKEGCGDCRISGDEGRRTCVGNDVYICQYNRIYNRYYYVKSQSCGAKGLGCGYDGCYAQCIDTQPRCTVDGEFRCSGTSRERCTNGAWTLYENCASSGRVCEVDPNKKATCVECHTGTASAYCSSKTQITQCFNGKWKTYSCSGFGDYVCSGSPASCNKSNPTTKLTTKPTTKPAGCSPACRTNQTCVNGKCVQKAI